MKLKLFTLIFIISCTFGFSQVNPEDIIIVYDSINPNGKVLLKSDLSKNLDSINIYQLQDKKIELLTKLDNLTIAKQIIGNWNLNSVERTNGLSYNLQVIDKIEFKENRKFKIYENKQVISGKWQINNGELTLNFNKPQCQIKEKTILKMLSKDQIKSITYNSNILHIKEIDNKNIVFMNFLQENTDNVDEIFFILILSKYNKVE